MTIMSTQAYAAIVNQLSGKRASVFALFQMGEGLPIRTNLTIREACDVLHWPHTTVSARIFELAEAGLIIGFGQRGGQTVWTATRPDQVEAVRAERAAVRQAKKDAQAKRLQSLEDAVKRARTHKAELFEDGVSADLAEEGVKTIPEAFMAGYNECHRIMIELLATEGA